ncbi:MAG: hypothetical protein ACTSQG_08030 [Promethearchaeota archaeon]
MSAYLEELNRDREDIIKISREMIRNCSIAIKLIHRTEFESYKEKIEEVKKNHKNLVDLVQKNPLIFSKYLKTPEQEYMEAISLYSIIKEKPFPNPIDYGVEKMNYLLGLADVIGELRRYILDNIRKEEMENIEKILEDMDTIYTYLFSLDYPRSIIHDLRHKIDVARNIIEKTRGDITLAIQVNKLNQKFIREK